MFTKEWIISKLKSTGEEQKKLHQQAVEIRKNSISNKVYFRGLIEFSNICKNDCYYCGIRKSNKKVNRYRMSKEEILDSVDFCAKANYGSIVLQSGQDQSDEFIDFVTNLLIDIKKKYPEIGITLCVGEQSYETYKRFFEAGAHRYLLRIETSDEEHYRKLHPDSMSFSNREQCLNDLKKIGYQVGTGVMIGSKYQTLENLANDLLYFKNIDVDMVGMGPYLSNSKIETFDRNKLDLSLNMIAILRIIMPDINIASTTALQALHPEGREFGFLAGANVIMPIVTSEKYRKDYQLYNNKPCIDESSNDCLNCVTFRIESVNMIPAFGEWGDSIHFQNRRI